jgi:N6-L-threonylcarbamoyladenine synthase
MAIVILGIESSCDDTSAAVVIDGILKSNVVAGQDVHRSYGGVVPELASRAHQQNIIPVVHEALKNSNVQMKDISAVAFTRGPGLLGSLLVGASFSKGFAIARDIPLIEVNHLHAHLMVHFIKEADKECPSPAFPFLCLLVSGGHTQIILVKEHLDMEILGNTIDDAAGEAFDKCAKILGFPYPGGPFIDDMAQHGNENAFSFAKPKIAGLDFSFSGLKTSFLYFLRDKLKEDKQFINDNKADLCASLQKTISDILIDKIISATDLTGISEIAIAGGVSANSGLQKRFLTEAAKRSWNLYIPDIRFSSDNAAMIAITGYFKFLQNKFSDHHVVPLARYKISEKLN